MEVYDEPALAGYSAALLATIHFWGHKSDWKVLELFSPGRENSLSVLVFRVTAVALAGGRRL